MSELDSSPTPNDASPATEPTPEPSGGQQLSARLGHWLRWLRAHALPVWMAILSALRWLRPGVLLGWRVLRALAIALGNVLLDAGIALALACMPLLTYWRVLTTNMDDAAHFVIGDFFELHYPYRRFVADELASGRLAAWNPFVSAGHPALGDIQFATLYPVGWLFAWLGGAGMAPSMLEAQVVFHLSLAAVFAYLFGRRILQSRLGAAVLAVVFVCGGYMNGFVIQQMIILQVSVWLPLVLLFIDIAVCWRSPAAAIPAGMALAIAATAGHPQTWFYVLLGAAAYLAYRSLDRGLHPTQLVIAGVVFGLGFALALPQLWPAYEHLQLTDRGQAAYKFTTYGFAFQEMTGVLVPVRFGGQTLYQGILTLVLAALALVDRRWARAKRFWLLFGLVALLTSFGEHSILQSVLHIAVPPLKFRDHERLAFLVSLAAAVLAGYGADSLAARQAPRDDVRRVIGWGIRLAIGLVAAAALFGYGAVTGIPEVRGTFDALMGRSLFTTLLLAVSIALVMLRLRAGKASIPWQVLIVLFVGFDLISTSWRLNTWDGDPELRYPNFGIIAMLNTQAGGLYRISSEGLLPGDGNAGSVYRLQDLVGNSPLEMLVYQKFSRGLNEWQRWRLLNVRYIVTKRDFNSDGRFRFAVREGELNAYELKEEYRLPRAWVVRQITFALTDEEALSRLAEIDPARTAVTTDETVSVPASAEPRLAGVDEVTVTRFQSDQVDLHARLVEPGLLVVSEIYHPDWTALVDGAPRRIHRVDGVLRGIPLAAGEHDIRFRFEPAAFTQGLALARTAARYALYLVAAEAGLRLAYVILVAVYRLARRNWGRIARIRRPRDARAP